MTFSENVARLQPSATMAVSSLAKRLRAEGRDIIDLSAGEPDFDTPSWLVDAAVEGVRAGATRYTPAAGMPDLRAAIADSLVARGADAAWNDVVVTAGAKQALFNACFTFFGPGDEVMIASPYWTSYPEMVTLSRAEPVFVQGPAEKNFVLRPEDLEAARTERTRGLIMCSPSNPTGAVYTRDELAAVARWARDNDVRLINDEIYRHIHFDGHGTAPGLLELDPGDVGPFVLIDGVSKAFAMTGWRIGFSYCEGAGAKKMAAFQSHTTSTPPPPPSSPRSQPTATWSARSGTSRRWRKRTNGVSASWSRSCASSCPICRSSNPAAPSTSSSGWTRPAARTRARVISAPACWRKPAWPWSPARPSATTATRA